MRLTAIKLAGFKSFVDATTFTAPTNLTGIVGPNGCGKSNIIDAVRWVMGEGSAKVLRGESMADVIFSGSSSRKPVGTASVELVFDNSSGRIAGEFAGYNEISVKRIVGRDGVSQYTLNGTRCRRKDVRDLFLGTGLGSKSYSIIEQGMISQVVDAGPEEVRSHLEEAAGISRYKERRRETERRIKHTRENLDRLTDLREEIAGHLSRLKRQANAAERYKKLKIEQRELQSSLLTLQWSSLKNDADTGRSGLAVQETAMQEQLAEQRAAEARMEALHQEQAAAGEAFNQVQGELYSVGSEIARLEQTIQHSRELQTRQKKEYEETSASLQDMEKHMVLDRAQVEDLTKKLAEVEPPFEAAQKEEVSADAEMQEAEAEVAQWQESLEKHHVKNNELNRKADSQQATLEMLDGRMQDAANRLKDLAGESEGTDTGSLSFEVADLEKQAELLAGQLSKQQQRLEKDRQSLADRRQALQASTSKQHELLGEINRREGRLESLKALQQAARANDNGLAWLESNGLESAPRLVERLEVAPGWEAAAETVLGFWLESVLVDQPADLSPALGVLATDSKTDFDLSILGSQASGVETVPGSLAEKVTAPDVITAQLNRVRIATSLESAFGQVEGKLDGTSAITAEGQWIGPGWVRVAGSQSGQAGILARKQEIESLQKETQGMRQRWADLNESNLVEREALSAADKAVNDLQQEVNGLHRQGADLDSRLNAGRARIGDLEGRQKRIAEEIAGLRKRQNNDEEQIKTVRSGLAEILDEMAGTEKERAALDTRRQSLLERRDAARTRAHEARNQRHELALKTESRRASLDSLRNSLQRMDSQFSQLQQRFLDLSEQMAQNEDPEETHRETMDGLLQSRVAVEQRLTAARANLQKLEDDYRQLDAARQTCVRQVEEIRGSLEKARLQQQELELNARNLQRQVEQLGHQVETLAENLPEDADAETWQENLERLQVRITRLEPVNLAAISEFEEESKRKDYMDAQHEDLVSALETLENAIKKIDRKTRTRFKDTFESVNKGIQELFPKLFGGGHAYLELTGDDLLTTGVSIMARPPGKRISSIHLMSGGEKALTAVAFVFAIFRLNPAPFCLLDEVDAPLDDANVSRFTAMVKEMSESVQFVVVTHNKITMEMVHQLSGVTMREPGVSRLVQVDIDEASRFIGD
ncbi:MAG: chromosome segregation protein SMC [Xanthomonadales bacterium]|nr:chromosome segregation protein SMC [Gammaproteobacteria bacterium]NNK04613.1 chromosome segregation protein SMC [Xanthomonadales bacterium]